MTKQPITPTEAPHPLVLVVDDDRNFCEAIARCLAQRGYDVTCADGGEVAVEAIGERRPDVIVTDVMMPGMDGIDLMNWLRDEGLDIPVIVISGDGDIEFAAKSKATQGALLAFDRGDDVAQATRDTAAWMGATSVLQKPFGRAVLEDSVARALKSQVTVH